MKISAFLKLLIFFTLINPYLTAGEDMTPELALKKLMAGNLRYAEDKMEHPRRDQFRREALQSSQSPFAIILTCSDSRVSPEVVFDQGLGDIFVVRVAGNVAGQIEKESIEYSAVYLKSSIILVLGHESCGAVKAVIDNQTKDIESIARLIEPAVSEAKKSNPSDLTAKAVKMNVLTVVDQLKNDSIIANLIKEKKIDVVGGYYHLVTGKIELLNH